MWKQLGLTFLVAGLSAVSVFAQDPTAVPGVESQGQETTIVGGDDTSLRAFILRYLMGNQQNADVDVLIESLPTDLPFTPAAPEDAILFGTVARHGGPAGSGSYYDIAYDTAQTPAELVEFFKQAYSADDWRVTGESITPPAAFSGQSSSYATFCYQDGVATLNTNAYASGNGVTNLNITVQVPGDVYACSNTSQGPVTDPLYALIPSLALPNGVSIVSNTGGGLSYYEPIGRSTYVSAVLESNQPLADLANNYNGQLSANGWQQVSAETSEHTALSTWSVTDDTGKVWTGTLLIVADNEPNQYNAMIYVEE